MQGKLVYEYAVLRLVPRIEREEFVNIGLLMMCKSQQFIKVAYELDASRIKALYPFFDIAVAELHLPAFLSIARGEQQAGLIGSLPLHERFRWLTAKRSTILQTSAVHGGITSDLESAFDKLYRENVTLDIS